MENSTVKITAQQLRDAAKNRDDFDVPVRSCSVCGSLTHFLIRGGEVFFDGACDCPAFGGWYKNLTWEYVADFINQTPPSRERDLMIERYLGGQKTPLPDVELWQSSTGYWLIKKDEGYFNLFSGNLYAPLGGDPPFGFNKTGTLREPNVDQFAMTDKWKIEYLKAVHKATFDILCADG